MARLTSSAVTLAPISRVTISPARKIRARSSDGVACRSRASNAGACSPPRSMIAIWVTMAAKRLKIGRSTLYRKMRDFGLEERIG